MSKQKNSIKVKNKSIIEFNQKYGFKLPIKPYRTGRIKRMRLNNGVTKVFKSKHRRYGKKLSDNISLYQGVYPTITRWNRH